MEKDKENIEEEINENNESENLEAINEENTDKKNEKNEEIVEEETEQTEEDKLKEEIIRLKAEGYGATKIAKELNIHRDSVYRLLKK